MSTYYIAKICMRVNAVGNGSFYIRIPQGALDIRALAAGNTINTVVYNQAA
jgi:hypothetical protein